MLEGRRTSRLEDLCGVHFVAEHYPRLAVHPTNATARIAPLHLEPDDPQRHVMRGPLRDGGRVYIVFNQDENQPHGRF